jgi:hypothetical protein
MPLEKAIARSRRWMEASTALIDGRTFETSNRSRVGVGLLHLAMEHHKGIHTLVDLGVLGSAFALLRPQIEAFVRGAWYFHCATDIQIAKFVAGGEPPSFSQMNRDLQQQVLGFEKPIDDSITKDGWRALCDFTHGGSLQVKGRITQEEVTHRFKVNDIVGLLETSTSLSLLAAVRFAEIAKDEQLANDLYQAYKKLDEQAA